MQIVERPNHILEIPYDGKIEIYRQVPLWTYPPAILNVRNSYAIPHFNTQVEYLNKYYSTLDSSTKS